MTAPPGPAFSVRDISFSYYGSWFDISPVLAERVYADDLRRGGRQPRLTSARSCSTSRNQPNFALEDWPGVQAVRAHATLPVDATVSHPRYFAVPGGSVSPYPRAPSLPFLTTDGRIEAAARCGSGCVTVDAESATKIRAAAK